ncbi:transcriptional regulator, LacI family [Caminicella sporogenes DSM 14501]|uniref:Transcriptional regulator, LacI family n=1 Tax=Caminicella sporogenes DSM 14501 TaxID=1121266 RepID=A0A1M6MKK3_9FIRM|nr:LacI family DNA-binding transcriptional regulator [Caminicella sporogenes]RKD27511.1 LacI family transcriptional regulator [Caminicella sporogenes]SHJ83900.1 transcriptional regulator, LacI family [Caminicella sporogenes DSM 14501]
MKNLNIKDIARIAGVGASTVSRVLNNRPDVNEETRKKILKIIEEYNYIPNNSARNLKRNESKNIGVIVKGIYNPFFAKIIKAIEEKIDEQGFTMILHYNDKDSSDIEAAIELIKEKRLKGLICLGGDFENIDERQIKSLKTPIVIASTNVSKNINKELISSVSIEDEKAAYKAVDYLCKLGHKKIAIISTGESDRSVGNLRIKGYKKALDDNKIKCREEFLEVGQYTFKSGYDAMNRLLDKNLELTAVFVTSDIMAIGASKAILSRGMKIPDDISIIGFDGLDYTEYFHPSITTIKQPQEDIGYKSIEILLDIIKHKKGHKHVILETKLLERESCKKII